MQEARERMAGTWNDDVKSAVEIKKTFFFVSLFETANYSFSLFPGKPYLTKKTNHTT